MRDFAYLPTDYQRFVAMSFMHSETSQIHQWAVDLFKKIADQEALDFEYRHKAIIDRFGRYPHRNAILVRQSTVESLLFLEEADSSF